MGELISQQTEIKNGYDLELEKLKKKYDEEMEKEVNKRIAIQSQLNRELNNKKKDGNISSLKDGNISSKDGNINDSETETLINSLQEKIKKLEIKNDETHDRFFKHNEIFEHKLKRALDENKVIKEKLNNLQDVHEKEIKILNDKIVSLKQALSEQNEVNIHLQQNLDVVFEENIRLKDMETDYHLFGNHIIQENDAMNMMLEELQN